MDGHAIAYDADRRLVTLRLAGFWDRARFEAFETEIMALSAATASLPSGGKLLVDLRDFAVQESWLAEPMRALLIGSNDRLDAVAIVGSASTLQRLQVKRALVAPNLRVFDAIDEARAWLFP